MHTHSVDINNTIVTNNDVHNFSSIVKPYHDSEQDRNQVPQAANDANISGQFSVFDQKKMTHDVSGRDISSQLIPPSLPSGRRLPPQASHRSISNALMQPAAIAASETPKFVPEIGAFKPSDGTGTFANTTQQPNLNPVLRAVNQQLSR